jgi:HEAT repeat protein
MGSNAVPFLTIAVNAKESSIHRTFVQLVWKVPPFRRFVSTNDPSEFLRARAGAVLVDIDARAGRDTVAALRKTLDDPYHGARCSAVVALRTARDTSAAPDAVAALIYATKDQNNVVRGNAYSVLRYFAPDASEAIPVLERGLQDPDGSVRRSATNGLAAFAPGRPHFSREDNAPGR